MPDIAQAKRNNLYRRLTSSMPLLVTVAVHVVLGLIAAAIVVQQAYTEKKKTFEAAPQAAAAPAVEHRLQVARRGGASGGSSSPVSANRIYSTAAGALAMPEMPDLPSMGASGFGGFGAMGGGIGGLSGNSMATSLGGGTGLGGRGFMSLSFLGTTSQNASNIIFVVDTSTFIMEPRKGGFRAFTIIREEIMRLVSRLPPSARFNVVLYRNSGNEELNGVEVNVFKRELVAATSDHKNEFFAWMAPVNARLGAFGPNSAASRTPWRVQAPPPESGADPLLLPPVWARATQVALEQEADTIYVITATQGAVRRRVDEKTLERREAEAQRRRAEFEQVLAREGLTPAAYYAAREAALRKAGAELAAANRRLIAQGRDPIVVENTWRIFDSSVQAALRRNGITITLDRTGWSRKDGTALDSPQVHVSQVAGADWSDFHAYLARLQNHFLSERARLNIFLFVGPDERAESAVSNLTTVARRNGGSFQLLTTARLEELRSRDEESKPR